MKRRIFIASRPRPARRSLMAGTALAQDKKPVSWWYETAAPENQENLQKLLVDAVQRRASGIRGQHRLSAAPSSTSSCASPCCRAAVRTSSIPPVRATSPRWRRPGSSCRSTTTPQKLGWNDRVLPVFLELGKYNGKLYALPKTYETLGLFYNKTLFEANGWTPPTTIAELETLADAMLAKGIVPFGAGNADWRPTNEHYVSIVLNSVAGPGECLQGAERRDSVDRRAVRQGHRYAQRLVAEGLFRAQLLLADRRAGIRPGCDRAGRHVADRHLELPERAALLPAEQCRAGLRRLPERSKRRARRSTRLGIGSTFSIAATSQNPDGAAAVIDYVFSRQVLRRHEHRLAGRVERAAARSVDGQASATTCCRSTPRR